MLLSKISLFIVDSWRYDCVGYQPNKKYLEKDHVLGLLDTPIIDGICKESVCFTKCYTTSVTTFPVVASMFSGTTQANHMVRAHYKTKIRISTNIITIAEILKKLGYITVFSCDESAIMKVSEITRGFDHDFSGSDENLFDFLEKHKEEKIFLFVLFEDVHTPYLYSMVPPFAGYNDDYLEIMKELFKQYRLPIPEEPWEFWTQLHKVDSDRKIWLPLYVKGVSKFDKGRFKFFMDKITRCGFTKPNESLMIITSDHGEGKYLQDKPATFLHGGINFYDEIVRVPLIVRLPDFKHELRNDLVSNIDIFRIILDLCTDNKTKELVKYKLYCINPFYEKRDYVWIVSAWRSFHDNPLQYHVASRCIVTKDRKYLLKGSPEIFLDKSTFELSNEEFVTKLYDDLYSQKSEPQERAKHIHKLNDGTITKEQLYEKFVSAPEYLKKNSFSVIDLKNDPFEEHPINPTRDTATLLEYSNYLHYMMDLEKPDIKSDLKLLEINLTQKNEQEIKDELKRLGYI